MKTHKRDVVIQRLDEWRYAVAVDGVVCYVGTQVECERRAAIWLRRMIARPRTEHWRAWGV
jgi:hypothetical protein